MAPRVDQLAFLLRRTAPEQKDQSFALAIELLDDGVGEPLPALAVVRAGQAAFDRFFPSTSRDREGF